MFLEVDVMAGATELDMEAAEQLIQLSGCCSGDGGGESESRSMDSVREKRCKKEAAGRKEGDKDQAAAVESCSRKRAAAAGEEEVDAGEVVIGGEARRRPRFRSLAAVYREARRRPGDGVVVRCRAAGVAEEDGERTAAAAANYAAAGKGR